MATSRKQRTGRLKVYKFKTMDDLDAYLRELRHTVHTVQYAKMDIKHDIDILLDARLAMMRERGRDG